MDSHKTKEKSRRVARGLGAAAAVPPHRSVTRGPPALCSLRQAAAPPGALCPSGLPGIGTCSVSIHHGGGRPNWGGCCRFPLWTPLAGGTMGVLKTSRWRLTLS